MRFREDEGKAASELALVVFVVVVVVVAEAQRKEGRKNVENIAMATYTTHSQRTCNALST
jgi:hypothetical protein